ncbi:recombinase family protein [Streptomyces sp. UG1]|uniref:recombinase family protein n=1 Tax=Streptomyces sp. UG1 TaxID=3417652 RepID=UPI003CF1B0B5
MPRRHERQGHCRPAHPGRLPCPSAHDASRNPHRKKTAWRQGAVRAILINARYTGYEVWNKQRKEERLLDGPLQRTRPRSDHQPRSLRHRGNRPPTTGPQPGPTGTSRQAGRTPLRPARTGPMPWISSQRDKEAARRKLDALPAITRKEEPPLDAQQIREIAESLGDIALRIQRSGAEQKGPLYEALGITISYEHATRTATVRSRPSSPYRQ